MEISLLRRAAIVTGGSKGIGLAVAARFAASGADVAIVARTAEPLSLDLPPTACLSFW
ncbi:MAG: SDR family NAD(P)-dependent oxidoreductase [Xanthobacteraceae bacterium]